MDHSQLMLTEIQSPIHARKSGRRGPGNPRPLDPPPIVQLTCSDETLHRHHLFLLSSERTMYCTAELFRVPNATPQPFNGQWTYYVQRGADDRGVPIYELESSQTRPPPHVRVEPVDFGNHIVLSDASEGHLLLGNRTVQAHVNPATGHIIFAFPGLGVLQIGHYMLRYRLCASTEYRAPTATCFGNVFTVQTAANFTGMQGATPLTQTLAPLKITNLRRN